MENITNIDRDFDSSAATFNIEAEQSLIGLLLITYITKTIQFEIVVIVTVIYLICFLGWFYFRKD